MTAPQLLGPAAATRLAETFAHFLWEGSAIVLVVALAWPALRRASASARYRVLVFALLLTAAAPLATFWALNANEAIGARRATSKGSAPSTLPELTPIIPRAFPLDQVRPQGDAIQPPSVAEYPSAFERYAPALLAAYAVGVLGMLIRLVWSLGAGQRLRRRSEPVDDPVLLAAMRRRAADLNLRFTPALLWCRDIAVPGVVGVVRPAILLPIAIACELSPQQVEAILAHELAHLCRWDHVVLILQHLIEAFLFFHPAVWILSRRIHIERENCCDDWAVARTGERFSYAEALLRIAVLACGTGIRITALSAVGEPSLLRRRIDRLLRPRRRERLYVTRPAALSLSIVCVMAMGLVLHARVEGPPPEGRQHAAAGPATAPTGGASDALGSLQRERQKLEMLESAISQAQKQLSAARLELDAAKIHPPYTPDEIARVSSHMREMLDEFQTLAVRIAEMQEEFGARYKRVLECKERLDLLRKQIDSYADEFNKRYVIKWMPDRISGNVLATDLSALEQCLKALKQTRAEQEERVHRLEGRSGGPAENRFFGDDMNAVIHAKAQNLLALERNLKHAEELLDHDRWIAAWRGPIRYTPDEIARVDPEMRADLSRRDELALQLQDGVRARGENDRQTLEAKDRLMEAEREIGDAAHFFNNRWYIMWNQDHTSGQIRYRNPRDLESLVVRLRQEYDAEKEAIRTLVVEHARRGASTRSAVLH